jgi:TfoX/Sxy family transcriptional regulator of competence genes|tara:strand:+ start:3435 stop:3716 length:282 start_codon:yes stop_codon:yes gene_type:complete
MMQDELLELRNLGKTSVQWLHAVGVHTKDQLVDRGPVRIYQAVKNRGFRANRVLLYALQGALLDVHWSDLEPDMKARLLQEAEHPITQLRLYE